MKKIESLKIKLVALALLLGALLVPLVFAYGDATFNGTEDSNWANANNWLNNVIAQDGDTVYINADVLSDSSGGADPSVGLLIVSGNVTFGINISVTTAATFYDTSTFNNATIYGNAEFHDSSTNNGLISGGGTATFYDSSTNIGSVDGDAVVNYPVARPLGGTVNGTISYQGYIAGCTDPSANNYNSSAVDDDGSCTYDGDIPGCTDPGATNYDSTANVDDGSCIYEVSGCTDPGANNYNSLATTDDGSCTYDSGDVFGCTDPGATNYNSSATSDDGSCTYDVLGCTDTTATNYNPSATTVDGSCTYPPATVIGVYFNGAVDGDWSNLENWWGDSGFSEAANELPYSSSTVYISSPVTSNSSSTPTVENAIFSGSAYISIPFVVGTMATFNDSSFVTSGITGSATFNTTHYDASAPSGGIFVVSGTTSWDANISGTVYGSDSAPITQFTFRDTAFNTNTVNADARFEDESYNQGTINGDATFTETTTNDGGAVTGSVDIYYPVTYPVAGSFGGIVTYHDYDPVVTTQAATSISESTSTLNGTVTNIKGIDVDEHGFTYGTSSDLSIVIATTTLGSMSGTSSFSSVVTSLTCDTTYYFRPYATNVLATGVGSILSFTTDACTGTSTDSEPDPDPTPDPQISSASFSSWGSWSGPTVTSSSNNSSSTSSSTVAILASTTTLSSIANSLCPVGYVCTPVTAPTPNQIVTPNKNVFLRNMGFGFIGEDVRHLQQLLNAIGFTLTKKGAGSEGHETTYFGAATRSALAKFQKSVAISPAVGYFGPITRTFFNMLLGTR